MDVLWFNVILCNGYFHFKMYIEGGVEEGGGGEGVEEGGGGKGGGGGEGGGI